MTWVTATLGGAGTTTCTSGQGSVGFEVTDVTSAATGLTERYALTGGGCRLSGPFTALRQ